MNSKTAKALRGAAQYKNQSKTPGTMPFPGIARLVRHPVYETRQADRSHYERRGNLWVKRWVTVTRLAHGANERPILAPLVMDQDPKSPTFGSYVPPFSLVPVTKPGRLNPTEPKGVYRALKKLGVKDLLTSVGEAILKAQSTKEVTA